MEDRIVVETDGRPGLDEAAWLHRPGRQIWQVNVRGSIAGATRIVLFHVVLPHIADAHRRIPGYFMFDREVLRFGIGGHGGVLRVHCRVCGKGSGSRERSIHRDRRNTRRLGESLRTLKRNVGGIIAEVGSREQIIVNPKGAAYNGLGISW